MRKQKVLPLLALLFTVVVFSVAIFTWLFKHDNKYTYYRPNIVDGKAVLNITDGGVVPLQFLVDGWEFYQYKLLTPWEISGHTPDANIYLGQYGGFGLGDKMADPHGQATYRLLLETDQTQREYALALPEIFSSYNAYINGKLVAQMGNVQRGEYAPQIADNFLSFTASGDIEIVVAVSNYSNYYSGITFPPAFGNPEQVHGMLSLELAIHSIVCTAAIIICLFCILTGVRWNLSENGIYLALLCIFFVCYAIYPVVNSVGAVNTWWYSVERTAYYAMLIVLVILHGRICRLPGKLYFSAAALGLVCCFLSAFPQMFYDGTARWRALTSVVLTNWQILIAIILVVGSVWGLSKGVSSYGLLVGSLFYATAIICQWYMPVYEPVYGGNFNQIAGFFMLIAVAVTLWQNAERFYYNAILTQQEKLLGDYQISARKEQSVLQQQYVKKVRKMLHETRNNLTLIRHYAVQNQSEKQLEYIDSLLHVGDNLTTAEYSGHELIDAILTVQIDRIKSRGIYFECDINGTLNELQVNDRDLTAILMNLLNNAVEGCQRTQMQNEQWIYLSIYKVENELNITCKNSALPTENPLETSKDDKQSHGYGLSIMEEIAQQYGGGLSVTKSEDSFETKIMLKIKDLVTE